MYLRNFRRSDSEKPEHVEAQAAEGRVERLLVEDADDGVLAVDRRHDGDAEVDGAALHAQAEAAVLGHALLRDVELRHHLDAADDRLVVPLVERLQGGVEHAVDPVLDQHLAVLRLQVDVGGAAVDGPEDQRVHEAHDRAVRGERAQRDLRVRLVVRHELEAQRLAGLLEEDLAPAVPLQDLRHPRGGGDHGVDRAAELELRLVHPREVVQPAEGQHDAPPRAPDGHAREADEQLERDLRPQRCVVGGVLEGIEREMQARGLTRRVVRGRAAFDRRPRHGGSPGVGHLRRW